MSHIYNPNERAVAGMDILQQNKIILDHEFGSKNNSRIP
jgi:hypothetical protein